LHDICVVLPALRDIHHTTSMAWYSLFVLKVPLNNKQTNKQLLFCVIVLWSACLDPGLTWYISYSHGRI